MDTQINLAVSALMILSAVAFIIMICFLVQLLTSFRNSLAKLDIVLIEAELKLKKLDSFMNSIKNVSDIAEIETEKLKNLHTYKRLTQEEEFKSEELADWLVSSIRLGVKIFKRR